jgi:site-specific DNA-methyltransferase (adenine-specific)
VLNWDPEHDLPFLYCAKAPKSERPQAEGISAHPTVKPLTVMRWLVRLVTPPGGLVLDPFAGTGTTGQACALEGFRCVLAERDPDSAELARVRLAKPVQQQMTLDLPALPTTE